MNVILSDISDLKGLEYCTALTELVLFENHQIIDISPLSGLTNLRELDLSGNQISDLTPLAKLTNLTELQLSRNQISDLRPLAGLTNLTELDLGWNEISDIAVLVSNSGCGSGDYIEICENYLDLTPRSDDMQDIQTLIDRGVHVDY